MALDHVKSLSVTIIFALSIIATFTTEIRLFQSIFRHGDRYPLSFASTQLFYPTNPYANVSWYPDSDGHLTMEGKRSSYELGKILRAKYGDYFQQLYSKKTVRFISTDNARCIASASLVAAALFAPNNGSQTWNPVLNWQPVSILLARWPENIGFHGSFMCSTYSALLKETKANDPVIKEYDHEMADMYDYVSSNTGSPVNNRILYYFYLEFLATMSGGLPLPKWADSIMADGSLKRAAIQEYRFSSWTNELKRMTGGIWLKQWLAYVDQYIRENVTQNISDRGKNDGKIRALFYSGHDINIAGLMNTLGIFYPHVPNYSSAINLELHEDENHQFYIKAVHRNSGDFLDHVIPGCDTVLCPLETFRNIFSNVLPKNATLECGKFDTDLKAVTKD